MPLFRQKLSKNVKPGKPGVSLRGFGGPGGSQECSLACPGPLNGAPLACTGPSRGGLEAPPNIPKSFKRWKNGFLAQEKRVLNTGKTTLKHRKTAF